MKLKSCKLCSLCKSRLHISYSNGAAPASVLVVFGKESYTQRAKFNTEEFITSLSEKLEGDLHYTYAVRCFVKEPVGFESVKACRVWVNMVLKKVDPYLIILMGDLAVTSLLGRKYKILPKNIFYDKEFNGKKRKYFIAEKISSPLSKVQNSIERLFTYIEDNYG